MLDELRRKPKDTRNRYAFGAAAALTGVITLIWLVSLQIRLTDTNEVLTIEPETQGVFSEFFGQVKYNAANTISGFRSGYEEVKNNSESPPTDTETVTSEQPTQSDNEEPSFSWSTGTPTTTDNRRVIIVATSSASNTEENTSE